MPLAFTGIFQNTLAYFGIFQKKILADIYLVKSSRTNRIKTVKTLLYSCFDAPLIIHKGISELLKISSDLVSHQ